MLDAGDVGDSIFDNLGDLRFKLGQVRRQTVEWSPKSVACRYSEICVSGSDLKLMMPKTHSTTNSRMEGTG